MNALDAYRQSEEAARKAAEFLIPERTERTECLTLFADSLVQAHKNGFDPAVWSVTLGLKNYIRLNIGVVEACALFPDVLHIVVDGTRLTDAEREELYRQGGVMGKYMPHYVRVEGSQLWDLPTHNLKTTFPIFHKAYNNLIESAAESVKWRTGYYIHHSQGILDYLRSTLQRPLPDPVYSISFAIAQAMKHVDLVVNNLEQEALLKKIKMLRREEKRLIRKQQNLK